MPVDQKLIELGNVNDSMKNHECYMKKIEIQVYKEIKAYRMKLVGPRTPTSNVNPSIRRGRHTSKRSKLLPPVNSNIRFLRLDYISNMVIT
jgi:hypothetical protein